MALKHQPCEYDKEDPDTATILRFYDKESAKERTLTTKCADTSNSFSSTGFSLTKVGLYINAIEYYNKALCFAMPNTTLEALLYSYRANAYFNMGLYEESILSFKLALEHNFPDELRSEVITILKICHFELEKKKCQPEEPAFRIRLSYPPNTRNPYVIEGVHVEENDQFGRHLVTEFPLNVGDVICIEEAFASCISPAQRYNRCTNCLQEVPHLLFPCKSCTNAMFCSKHCHDVAWEEFHSIECSLTDELIALKVETISLAFRAFLKSMKWFNNSLVELQFYLKRAKEQQENRGRLLNPFDLDYWNLNKKHEFLAYFNGHSEDRHLHMGIRKTFLVSSITMASLLGNYTEYESQMRTPMMKLFVIELMRHLVTVNANNCYEIGVVSRERSQVAIGLFLNMSMASHACAPNVRRMRVDVAKHMWVVTRPIKAGGQILDTYGSCFYRHPLEERQERCRTHYGFDCDCIACHLNFPTEEDLPVPSTVPFPCQSFLTPYQPLTFETASAELRELRAFITDYQDYFPCAQLKKADSRLGHLFNRMVNDPPLEIKHPEFVDTSLYAEKCEIHPDFKW